MHPCCWCNISFRDLHQIESPRTIGSIKKVYNEYVSAGKDIETAKCFENTVHLPIFFKNFDDLQFAESLSAHKAIPIIHILQRFNKAVESCFGNKLCPNYQEKIQELKASFLSTNLNTTPKVHVVFYHIEHFIQRKECSLGIYSEQATEALHHNFQVYWD